MHAPRTTITPPETFRNSSCLPNYVRAGFLAGIWRFKMSQGFKPSTIHNTSIVRTRLLLVMLFVLFSLCVMGQTRNNLASDQPYHPFRKVGTNYFNLQPLYQWAKLGNIPSKDLKQNHIEAMQNRPMLAWIGYPDEFNSNISTTYEVDSVHPDGLIVRSITRLWKLGTEGSKRFFLVNYPFKDSVSDGQQIRFYAIKTGLKKMKNGETLDMYDYGVPYDPFALNKTNNSKKSLADLSTNAVVNVGSNAVAEPTGAAKKKELPIISNDPRH
jgi:hypothetical protein